MDIAQPATRPKMSSPGHTHAAERYREDTANHVLSVLHDDGLYRHLHVATPGTGIHHFDVVTYPGYLVITGDVADFTFARDDDMLTFFASGRDINPHYWAEKIVATDRYGGAKSWSPSKFREAVSDIVRDHITEHDLSSAEQADLWSTVRWEVLDHAEDRHTAMSAIDAWTHDHIEFTDAWEWDTEDWTRSYLWTCFAVREAALWYHAHVSTRALLTTSA